MHRRSRHDPEFEFEPEDLAEISRQIVEEQSEPESTGTHFSALPIDPAWAHVSWELPPDALTPQGRLYIRVTQEDDPSVSYDIAAQGHRNYRDIELPNHGQSYSFELGAQIDGGNFESYGLKDAVELPVSWPSDEKAAQPTDEQQPEPAVEKPEPQTFEDNPRLRQVTPVIAPDWVQELDELLERQVGHKTYTECKEAADKQAAEQGRSLPMIPHWERASIKEYAAALGISEAEFRTHPLLSHPEAFIVGKGLFYDPAQIDARIEAVLRIQFPHYSTERLLETGNPFPESDWASSWATSPTSGTSPTGGDV